MECGHVRAGVVYAILMGYPEPAGAKHTRTLSLKTPQGVSGTTKVELLGVDGELPWQPSAGGTSGIDVVLPPPPLGSGHAWTLKLTGLKNA